MIKKLTARIGQYKKQTIATPLFMVGEVGMEVLIPLIMSWLIDRGIERGDMSQIWVNGLLLLAALLLVDVDKHHATDDDMCHFATMAVTIDLYFLLTSNVRFIAIVLQLLPAQFFVLGPHQRHQPLAFGYASGERLAQRCTYRFVGSIIFRNICHATSRYTMTFLP